MTERMIDLQREKHGLPTNQNPIINNGASAAGNAMNGNSNSAPALTHTPQTYTASNGAAIIGANPTIPTRPGQQSAVQHPNTNISINASAAAAAASQQQTHNPLHEEDEQMQCFLHLLSTSSAITPPENDLAAQPSSSLSSTNTQTSSGNNGTGLIRTEPTVPLALSRRILNRQGVGYLDQTVSAIVSGAADRFLATVLHQSIECQDRRITGENFARKQERERRKVEKRGRAERRAKKRKRRSLEKKLEDEVKKLDAADSDKGAGSGGSKKKKKKKVATTKGGANNKKNEATNEADLQNVTLDKGFMSETDSIEEEEAHYENFYGDSNNGDSDENGDESDGSYDEIESDDDVSEVNTVLQLRDVVRPLETWGISLTGKLGLNTNPTVSKPANEEIETDIDLYDDIDTSGTEQGNSDDDDDPEIDEEEQDEVTPKPSTPKAKAKTTAKRKPTKSKVSTSKASNNSKKRSSSPKPAATTPKRSKPAIEKGTPSSNTSAPNTGTN